MTKKKLAYEAPKTESLVVRFEGLVCTSPNYGGQGAAGANQNYNEYGPDF